jgi:predicted RNase H-like nuclease (RuvC/YqgF family)
MLGDLESTIGEELYQMNNHISQLSTRTAALELKLQSVEGDTLGQVVRYVIGESLAKPGGLPSDIERLVTSSQKVEKGITNLSTELVHLIERVDRLERTEKERVGRFYIKSNPGFIVFVILVLTGILFSLLVL